VGVLAGTFDPWPDPYPWPPRLPPEDRIGQGDPPGSGSAVRPLEGHAELGGPDLIEGPAPAAAPKVAGALEGEDRGGSRQASERLQRLSGDPDRGTPAAPGALRREAVEGGLARHGASWWGLDPKPPTLDPKPVSGPRQGLRGIYRAHLHRPKVPTSRRSP